MRLSARMLAIPAAIAIVAAFVATTPAAGAAHKRLDCSQGSRLCTELENPEAFGEETYVGHDEPSLLFYSDTPGSGNHMTYRVKLPSDPSGTSDPRNTGKSYNFQLHIAPWFGMAMCDDQSYPESQDTYANAGGGTPCTPDSDSNIYNSQDPNDPKYQGHHPGVAFMEMQFYPPGFALWPPGASCDATKWCAALNIDSYSQNAVTGAALNPTCQAVVGIEYVNFAFITHDGVPVAPPNPIESTGATFDPTSANPHHDDVSFFNSGDELTVALADTDHGLRIDITDATHPSESGHMVASASNGFGAVRFDPTGTSCDNIPYDFHPMYSTSSEATQVIWAAHTYNIAFSDEIGHFDYCGNVNPKGKCSQNEGMGGDIEPSDKDDNFCFPASASSAVLTSGCYDSNIGFDGTSYLNIWPDGNARHAQPWFFTSPTLADGSNYSRVAFEADLPRIETPQPGSKNSCNRATGTGCVNPPLTDDGAPATFYPFFSTASTAAANGRCVGWIFGNDISFSTNNNTAFYTLNDFGKNAQFGPLYLSHYITTAGDPTPPDRYNNFHNGLASNPCPA